MVITQGFDSRVAGELPHKVDGILPVDDYSSCEVDGLLSASTALHDDRKWDIFISTRYQF